MGGQKFQYDENGGTFFYFVISFLALVLIPATYYWWPRKDEEDPDEIQKQCSCPPCLRKREILSLEGPWKKFKSVLIKALIVLGWVLLFLLAYRVSQFDYEMANFDPYEILQLSPGATKAQARRSYKQLSLIYHPDKETGSEELFRKLTKAHQALTDEEAMRNYERYGNPDGPGAMDFGIALPAWIVERDNAVWVLGAYALVFMIALPTAVGIWWYSSIQYSGDKVLLDTTQLYYFMFHKTPSMPLKRVLMVLGASSEFNKRANKEVKERPTDNVEVPQLMRQLPQLNEKNKELPLCLEYSIKARALLHAHLTRIELNPETLEKDRQQVVAKCPTLIQEMVSCTSQLVLLAYARRIPASKFLRIDTIENVMKLSPMLVQGLWEYKSPLLQLPHVSEDHLKYFTSKKRHIKTVQQLAQMKAEDRRAVLRSFSDSQYEDIMKVMATMPYIECTVESEVIDDEATKVYTAGAIVTVTVTLRRQNLKVLFGDETIKEKTVDDNEEVEEEEKKEEAKETKVQRPVWQKQNKKQKPTKKKKNRAPAAKTVEAKQETPVPNGVAPTSEARGDDSGSESESGISEDDADRTGDEDDDKPERKESDGEDDDHDWDRIQRKMSRRDRILNSKGKKSHSVHCPYYPLVKQEYWWVYICDRKNKSLLAAPYHVTNLVEEEKVELKFTAPKWPGFYTFTVCLRSDSYLGATQCHDLKLDVKEAPAPVAEHPQWDNVSDTEEKKSDQSDLSEFTTDDDVEDDD